MKFGKEEHNIGAVLRVKFSPVGKGTWLWKPPKFKTSEV